MIAGAMEKLEERIGYRFRDRSLLEEALTHSSYANENPEESLCNERLEFLGDAVLSIIVAEDLFRRHKEFAEGELTKERASLVRESALFGFAKEIELGDYLRLGRGEVQSGGSGRASILADAMEALIAAVYLDGGYSKAKKFVLGFTKKASKQENGGQDSKSLLQEVMQKNDERVRYVVISETGPAHEKTFTVEARINSNRIGKGKGSSKKAAEQSAARQALELMGL